ncbi:unnamed protein product [Polarella glacialis]|uniref:Uncharacterized protein n=1 Tax=Polarella glacialis TaxID=89957 RepID=A0A813J8H5_POLGL|nr:unnamed protein product [Polarella glacialis]
MHLDWADEVWTRPEPNWRPPPIEQLRQRLLSQVNISNFQPAAIFDGLIDTTVWIRSDFSLGKYNSPAPGFYQKCLGLPDYSQPDRRPDLGVLPPQLLEAGSSARPLLCFWDLESPINAGSFHEYGELVPHEHRRTVLHSKDSGFPLEKNTTWEDVPPHWMSGRPPQDGYSVQFHQGVLTFEQLQAPGILHRVMTLMRLNVDTAAAEDGVHRKEQQRCQPWILDIDLDYFATFCPSLSAPINQHGWTSQEDSEAFAAWAIPFRMIVSNGLEPACPDLFEPSMFQAHAAREVTQLALLPSATRRELSGHELLLRFRRFCPQCQPPESCLDALAKLINGLSAKQQEQWRLLDGEDWHMVMQPHGPHHFASQADLCYEVQRLEVLAALPYPPALITVARSSDLYLPAEAAAAIEWEVLLLLRKIWPLKTSSDLKGELRNACRKGPAAAAADLALHGVHFHQPSWPVEPLRPQPWPQQGDHWNSSVEGVAETGWTAVAVSQIDIWARAEDLVFEAVD